jgi:hypothetical protein
MKKFVYAAFLPTLTVFALAMVMAGCDRHLDDDHDDFHRVEVTDRSQAGHPTIATWIRGQGWDVAQFPLTLTEGGARRSIGFRAFDDDGDQLELGTLEQHSDGTRTCTEYSIRWGLEQGKPTNVVRGPDAQGFVTVDGEQIATFHCDHVYLYPDQAGETAVVFYLYHVDHYDDNTSPLTVTVQPAAN